MMSPSWLQAGCSATGSPPPPSCWLAPASPVAPAAAGAAPSPPAALLLLLRGRLRPGVPLLKYRSRRFLPPPPPCSAMQFLLAQARGC